ncbi:phage scaffolding protein [Parablautia intestinalis]|uniref:phage scaffolding protein n=1 Tax=Parablautia intestinalis TaxID=2320100 RepID=UPI00256EF580|nr:phage scaffolding protein [Parablautia intestinalis]
MEWLKEILGEELYNQLIASIKAHNEKPENKGKQVELADLGKGEYISKEKYSALETDNGSLAEQLKTAQELITELKKGTSGDEALQGKIGEYETTIDTLQKQLAQEKLDSAVKIALLESKCKDVDYITFKLKEKGELALDESGKIKGMDDKLAALKTQFPSQFESARNTRIIENRLPDMADQGHDTGEPKNLAEALKQQYDENAD